MRGKVLLALFADLETRLFGLAAFERQTETWICRQREISRVYFAIGLTTSVIAGSIACLFILALSRGPARPAADDVAAHMPPSTPIPAIASASQRVPLPRAGLEPQVAPRAVDAVQPMPAPPAMARRVNPVPEAAPQPLRGAADKLGEQRGALPVAPAVADAKPPAPQAVVRPDGLSALGGPDRAEGMAPPGARFRWWHLPAMPAW